MFCSFIGTERVDVKDEVKNEEVEMSYPCPFYNESFRGADIVRNHIAQCVPTKEEVKPLTKPSLFKLIKTISEPIVIPDSDEEDESPAAKVRKTDEIVINSSDETDETDSTPESPSLLSYSNPQSDAEGSDSNPQSDAEGSDTYGDTSVCVCMLLYHNNDSAKKLGAAK